MKSFASLFLSLVSSLFLTGTMALAQATETVATGAADVAAAVPPQAPMWMQFVPFVIIIGVFYFFLIRPQAKKQKETLDFLQSIKVGDQVITQSGIFGRIAGMTDQTVTLEVANTVQIKILRAQILMSQSVLQAKKEGK